MPSGWMDMLDDIMDDMRAGVKPGGLRLIERFFIL
jgi:hypothetical protein